MPSGTEAAKEKFNEAIEKTRAPAEADPSAPAGDNPKMGAFVSGLAKGDTEASRYTAQGSNGNEKPGQK